MFERIKPIWAQIIFMRINLQIYDIFFPSILMLTLGSELGCPVSPHGAAATAHPFSWKLSKSEKPWEKWEVGNKSLYFERTRTIASGSFEESMGYGVIKAKERIP